MKMSKTLVWADDDEELTHYGGMYLERQGYRVRTATNGVDCLSLLERWQPDFFILDDELKWGECGTILSSSAAAVLLLLVVKEKVIVTSDDSSWLADNGVDLNNIATLRKPFRLSHIMDVIENT